MDVLPVLPLRDAVVFPAMVVPLFVGREKSVNALSSAAQNDNRILLVTQKESSVDNPGAADLYNFGVEANIVQLLKLPDGAVKVLMKGEKRVVIHSYEEGGSFLQANFSLVEVDEKDTKSESIEALQRSIISSLEIWSKLTKKFNSDVLDSASSIEDVSYFTDIIASNLNLKIVDKQKILTTVNIESRLEELYKLIETELTILSTQKKIRNRIKSQMENTQKVYYLTEQKKAIEKELGDADWGMDSESTSEFEEKIAKTLLSQEAKDKIESDLKRYKKMNPISPEATVISNYLHWVLDLPWGKQTDVKINLEQTKNLLGSRHYGMKKVKERVVEFLAVLKRVKNLKGPILCLVGPPGVGKTSLAKSIAEATGRNFVRISLGGLHDESEIRGHRRTYIGAMPGRIIQHLKKAKSSNPLILLDEIDKMGSDHRGDPASALLEALDPEHNSHFVDHYIEVEFDLSQVMFIATANSLNLPRPLIDRMEVIHISGYTEEEKVEISKHHLIPKLFKEHGLRDKEWRVSDDALYQLIRVYTKESGVRGLERELANLMRKAVCEILIDKVKTIDVDCDNLEKYSGVRKYTFGTIEENDLIGMVTGLAYTEVGGDILTIESVLMSGKGGIKFTGKLGEVMQESVQAAYSYIRSRCLKFGIKTKKFQTYDIHLHVPEGATPKDGPSAGIAMCTSIVSLMTNIPVHKTVAMTGEVSLRGRVLAIGGLKEKLLAALRGGIKTVIIPKQNEKDMIEIPDNVKQGLSFIFVSTVDEVIAGALTRPVVPVAEEDDEIVDVDNLRSDAKSDYHASGVVKH